MHIGGALHRQRAGRGDGPPGRDPRLDRGDDETGAAWVLKDCRRRPRSPFPESAKLALANTQLRRNMGKATQTIRDKRTAVVDEMPDWEALREAGRAIKERTLRHLDKYLLQLEESVRKAGGQVHWASDAEEARRIVARIALGHDAKDVIKVKSLTTDEIGLNAELNRTAIEVTETDLAELIVQLAGDRSSHILVPAIHKNRSEIRELFLGRTSTRRDLTDKPERPRPRRADRTCGRSSSRRRSPSAGRTSPWPRRGPSRRRVRGQRPDVPDPARRCSSRSWGSRRSCRRGPTWRSISRLLPRSSTAERMNPYNSFWTGVTPGDGPQEFHLILLDNGRTKVLEPTRSAARRSTASGAAPA